MDAVEFLKAKTRMCRKHRSVGLYCKNVRCPLAKVPTSPFGYATCAAAIAYYPEKAVAIVEKWAKENPGPDNKPVKEQ